ncbi:MAG: GNAT family N-acetyltransferase [Alteromonadaceae bacterium]|nr:GNAT family N-acetyltransferase [Alteromonadaceae bacterium]
MKYLPLEVRVASLEELGLFSKAEEDADTKKWIGDDASFDWHLSMYNDPSVHHMTLARNNQPIGYMTIVPVAGTEGEFELLRGITLPAYRGRYGVSWFLSSVNYAFMSLHAEVVWLDVFETNHRAIRVYRASGFKEVHTKPLKRDGDEPLNLVAMKITREQWEAP